MPITTTTIRLPPVERKVEINNDNNNNEDEDIEILNETTSLKGGNFNKKQRVFRSVNSESRLSRAYSENNVEIKRTKSKSSLGNRSLSKDSTCGRIYSKNRNTLRIYDEIPKNAMPPLHILNQDEVKRKFFESKIPPFLEFKGNKKVIQGILFRHSKPNYKYFFKAKHILDLVKKKFGTDPNSYFEANFGKRVTSKQCINLIGKYLVDNKIGGEISINFAPGLTCSGRITSYNWQKNKPEARKFVVWINDGDENQFLREHGIVCLSDHEIGTHYYRSYNEGLQIWFSDRKKFGLRSLSSTELLRTEEGLAALHTLMNARLKYLFLPALLYYLVCMAHRMNFQQLFDHMQTYISSPEERWKHVTRVKRGISDPFEVGCYSRDQSYFEGAIEILESLETIDFKVLMCGKLCVDELDRIRRLARTECIKMPKFSMDMKSYKQKLRQIGIMNGILDPKQNKLADDNLDEIKTTNDLYAENDRRRKLNNYEVEKYIDEVIIRGATSKQNTPRQPKNAKDEAANAHSSSLCTIL